jgi:hypothetical protein
MWLFGLERKAHHRFTYQAINPGQSAELNFIARYILDELGMRPPNRKPPSSIG